ncbi:Uncharacterized membrane protein YjjP, DUF1212 family [Cetobacterium ceti]|uniref:Uncharacterized membrane protein YjjP, DUF1212 family n=1 Tax=Cetobacterium ceti TaxID=180163 RepID=A0A1T4LLA1_9FUSO|nr:threonine/serine exporter family protein [Cetobacterium ceti]SJZ55509.1 Uncharacterized membrane protein YjjP, DUF1212 family [Cetobacterium ceti]
MLKEIKDQFILKVACLAGKIVLENGGEIYRVEDVVCRIGAFYGLKIECFATLTCIMASSTNENGDICSLVKRISSRSTNLNKVFLLNNVVRSVEKFSFVGLQKELIKIYNEKGTEFYRIFIGYSLGAGSFVYLFKGDYRDFIPAFISGAITALSERLSSYLHINGFFTNTVSGAICSLIPYLFYHMGIITNPSISIISALMLLVPGVAFINSIRDIIAGDLLAGISRAVEVLMVGLALAVGAGLSLKLLMLLGGLS